ncbi:hypothetical protein [Bradyrhizobium liaoningense]|uniref:hypothetical protein n=1 Tax=Bradyrhizobium liaoningense TaxID=43992 RepID=UPI001BAC5605|nr:hypothetical protein [Bradyrhizobium liaoningense]MBR0852833.1 hypothetical protein [Bradyrhizobium liaoningense]
MRSKSDGSTLDFVDKFSKTIDGLGGFTKFVAIIVCAAFISAYFAKTEWQVAAAIGFGIFAISAGLLVRLKRLD